MLNRMIEEKKESRDGEREKMDNVKKQKKPNELSLKYSTMGKHTQTHAFTQPTPLQADFNVINVKLICISMTRLLQMLSIQAVIALTRALNVTIVMKRTSVDNKTKINKQKHDDTKAPSSQHRMGKKGGKKRKHKHEASNNRKM